MKKESREDIIEIIGNLLSIGFESSRTNYKSLRISRKVFGQRTKTFLHYK